MMEVEALKKLAAEIQSLGYDEKTAKRYASLIGDTPAFDTEGHIVIMDQDGKELARLKLKFFKR